MLDQTTCFGAADAADLDLLLSPGDLAEFVATCHWRRRDRRVEASQLWLVLHRRHGTWTHAYRVVRHGRPGQITVWLERAAEGDRRAELRAWLVEQAAAA